MNPALDDFLDRCLQEQLAGTGRACPDGTPQDSAELLPLIELAQQIASLPAPEIASGALDRNRERMLARVGNPQPADTLPLQDPARSNGHSRPVRGWNRLFPGSGLVRAGAAVALLLVLSAVFAVNASAQSLPGETLYPVKIAVEQVRISLTSDPRQRSALQQFFQSERQDDIQKAAAGRQNVQIDFEGVLHKKGFTAWQVGKLWVTVSGQTVLVGYPQVGDALAVTVHTGSGGTLAAEKIQVLEAPTPASTHPSGSSGDNAPPPAQSAVPAGRPAARPHPPQKPGAKPEPKGGGSPVSSSPPAVSGTAVPPEVSDTPNPPSTAAVGLNPSASPSPTPTGTPTASATPSAQPTASPTPSPSATPTETLTAIPPTSTSIPPLPSPTPTASMTGTAGTSGGLPPQATPAPTDYYPTSIFVDPTPTQNPTNTPLPPSISLSGTGIFPPGGTFPTLQAFGPPNPVLALPTWLPFPPPAATFAASSTNLVATPTPQPFDQ